MHQAPIPYVRDVLVHNYVFITFLYRNGVQVICKTRFLPPWLLGRNVSIQVIQLPISWVLSLHYSLFASLAFVWSREVVILMKVHHETWRMALMKRQRMRMRMRMTVN